MANYEDCPTYDELLLEYGDDEIPYSELLKTKEWKERRQEIITQDGGRCYECNSDRFLEVHHEGYRWGVLPWDYEDDELFVLCRDCHQAEHDDEDEED